jgi:plastocyanin
VARRESKVGLFALIAVAALLAGCSSGLNRPIHEVTAVPGGDGVQRVDVTAHAFYFEPNRIILKANVPAELHVKNGSPMIPHNFSCIAPQAGITVDEGLGLLWDGETAKFTPTTAGEYNFFCKVDHHANKGMTGKIVVVP